MEAKEQAPEGDEMKRETVTVRLGNLDIVRDDWWTLLEGVPSARDPMGLKTGYLVNRDGVGSWIGAMSYHPQVGDVLVGVGEVIAVD